MNTYVAGDGPYSAKLVIVGEFPTREDTELQQPFSGMVRHLLKNIFYELNYNLNECYLTYAIKYKPPFNDTRRYHEIGIDYHKEIENLHKEIEAINPNCILAFGKEALFALTGQNKIQAMRGSILQTKGYRYKVVPTYHPSQFIRSKAASNYDAVMPYKNLTIVKLDIARAIKESETSKLELPRRRLEIARDSGDTYRFLRQYENQTIAAADIESIKNVPSCISFAFNKHHAMSIPLMPGLLKTDSQTRDIAENWRMVEATINRVKIVGQNFKYDAHKLEKPCGFSRIKLHADVAAKFHLLYPEFLKRLEFMASILTREPYYKDEYKEWDPTKQSYEDVLFYNAKDSAVTYECHEVTDDELKEAGLYEFYYNFQHEAHEIYLDIEDCGMLVDLDKREELKVKYITEIKETQKLIDLICGRHVNVGSAPQMKRLCEEFLELPKRASYNEETLVALMQNNIKKESDEWKKDVLRNVLKLRKLKLVKTNYILARPDFDGRMRCTYNINGTENGRTSTSKLDSKKLINRPAYTGIGYHTISKHGTVGTDVRYLFIPDPGHSFVNMDFSQAEPRIVAVLSEDWELVEKFNKGIDVHSELASFISGKSEWDGKRAPEDTRFLGKTGRNAYNYAVGKRTFAEQVNTDADKFNIDIRISEWKAGEILKKIGLIHPKVVDVFHAKVRQLIDETRTLYNPFGRRRQFFDRLEEAIYREALAFIPQSTVKDQMLKLMIAFRKEFPQLKKKICLEAHDALMVITPNNMVNDVAPWLLNWPKENKVNFSRCSLPRDFELILPSEVEVSDKSYKELKKYKLAA